VASLNADQRDERVAHARVVLAGVVLLLLCSLPAIGVVLYQPFRGGIGGTLPALNFPGPKLWAMPLLQRAIGNGPAEEGVYGTRVAMVSLLALWLITIAPRDPDLDPAPTLRKFTRWVGTVTFGLGAGLLLASGGIWPGERFPYWMVLGGGIELPSAALLYAYLALLAKRLVPTKSLHATFGWLVWVVPLLIAGSVMLFVLDADRNEVFRLYRSSARFTKIQHAVLSGALGVLLLTAGVVATAAVSRLAAGLFAIAFPRSKRVWAAAGMAVRGTARALRGLDPARARAATVAGGIVLWIVASLACVDATGNLAHRKGFGGNLPFFNYLGPKATVVPIETGFGGRWTTWYALPGVHAVLLNLLAIALVTTPLIDPRGRNGATAVNAVNAVNAAKRSVWMTRLAMVARWWPVVAVGGAFGACQGWRFGEEGNSYSYYSTLSASSSEMAAAGILLCELPVTVMLYVLLSGTAAELGLSRVARTLRWCASIAATLMAAALASFVVSRWLLPMRQSYPALFAGGLYGAVSAGTALAATLSLLAVAATLLRDRVLGAETPSATSVGTGTALDG
jgi:hypothetical protein